MTPPATLTFLAFPCAELRRRAGQLAPAVAVPSSASVVAGIIDIADPPSRHG